MATSFKTESEAKAAIRKAVEAGKATDGHVSENWSGPRGSHQFFAHVRNGGTGWCL